MKTSPWNSQPRVHLSVNTGLMSTVSLPILLHSSQGKACQNGFFTTSQDTAPGDGVSYEQDTSAVQLLNERLMLFRIW